MLYKAPEQHGAPRQRFPTLTYDNEFYDRYQHEDMTFHNISQSGYQPPHNAEESDVTTTYSVAKTEIKNMELARAFDPFVTGPAHVRLILDPFFLSLEYLDGQMHDLAAEGKMVDHLKQSFDMAIEKLVRADWNELHARGANWNSVCEALQRGLERIADVFGVHAEVSAHIEGWFAFYREHGMALSQQRERREQLNATALRYHQDLAYCGTQPESVKNVEQVKADLGQRLQAVTQEVEAMGYDPQYVGAFTNQSAKLQEKADKVDEDRKTPTLRPAPLRPLPIQPEASPIYASYMKDKLKQQVQSQPQKKEGLFTRMKKKVAGWFGRQA